jgi:hypothetical protein
MRTPKVTQPWGVCRFRYHFIPIKFAQVCAKIWMKFYYADPDKITMLGMFRSLVVFGQVFWCWLMAPKKIS